MILTATATAAEKARGHRDTATPTFDTMSAANLAAERARDALTSALCSRTGDTDRVNVIPRADRGIVVIFVGAPDYSLTIHTDGREVAHRVSPDRDLAPTSRGARVLAAVHAHLALAADALTAARDAALATTAHREATSWTVRALDGVTMEYHATARSAHLARDTRLPGALIIPPVSDH